MLHDRCVERKPGERIASRFVIDSVAGAGGLGTVYKAWDDERDAFVALKILHDDDPAFVRRLFREASLLAALEHPAIVGHVAHGKPEGMDDGAATPYLAMEWLEGIDLADRLSEGRLPVADAVALCRAVAGALAVMHEQGIVHRDLKPSNLFLIDGDPRRVKVLDLGIAHVRAATRLTQTGNVMGTPGYLAPEQVRGAKVDERADVFALGCVLSECLTGERVFDGEDLVAILAKILLEPAPRLSALVRDVPPALEGLVARMLAKARRERPRDGHALCTLLEALPTLADAPAHSARKHELLSTDEMRFVALVGASEAVPGGTDETVVLHQMRKAKGLLADAVKQHGGRLELLAGEADMIAVFEHGDSGELAQRGAHCALAIHAAAPELRIALCIGRLESGSRRVGPLLDDLMKLVNGAQRGCIAVQPAARALLGERFDFDVHGQTHLLSRERVDEPVVATDPWVGRKRELATLEASFQAMVEDEQAVAIVVDGPHGIGKTRLCHELLGRLRKSGESFELWSMRADPMCAGSAFSMLRGALRRAAGIRYGDHPAKRRKNVAAFVLDAGSAEPLLPVVAELMGAEGLTDGLGVVGSDPLWRSDVLCRAFGELIVRRSRRRPILVHLDNVQWADRPSMQLLDRALRDCCDAPFFVLASGCDAARFSEMWAARNQQLLRLSGLSTKASERLVQAIDPRLDAALARDVVRSADGNPQYLKELLQWRNSSSVEIPSSVIAMAEARIAALEPVARRTLRAASVFGWSFWPNAVRELVDEEGLLEALDDLVARDLVVQSKTSRFVGEDELSFRQELVRGAAYEMLTDHDRELGHRLAADWLERAGESDPVIVAEHRARGGQVAESAHCYRLGAEQALARGELEAALRLANNVDTASLEKKGAGGLRHIQAVAHRWRGNYPEAAARSREALSLLTPGSLPWLSTAGEAALVSGMIPDRDLLEEVLDGLRVPCDADATAAWVIAAARAAWSLLSIGRTDEASQLLKRAGERRASALDGDLLVAARWHAACAAERIARGDLLGTLRQRRASLDAFSELGDMRSACNQRVNMADVLKELGRYEEASALLEDARRQAERLEIRAVSTIANYLLGHVESALGRHAHAARLLEAAIESFRREGNQRLQATAHADLAEARLRQGDVAGAEASTRAALDLDPPRPIEAHVRALLSLCLMRADGRLAGAYAEATRAHDIMHSLDTLDEGEMLVYRAVIETRRARGEHEAASEACRTALARLHARADSLGAEHGAAYLAAPPNAAIIALARK